MRGSNRTHTFLWSAFAPFIFPFLAKASSDNIPGVKIDVVDGPHLTPLDKSDEEANEIRYEFSFSVMSPQETQIKFTCSDLTPMTGIIEEVDYGKWKKENHDNARELSAARSNVKSNAFRNSGEEDADVECIIATGNEGDKNSFDVYVVKKSARITIWGTIGGTQGKIYGKFPGEEATGGVNTHTHTNNKEPIGYERAYWYDEENPTKLQMFIAVDFKATDKAKCPKDKQRPELECILTKFIFMFALANLPYRKQFNSNFSIKLRLPRREDNEQPLPSEGDREICNYDIVERNKKLREWLRKHDGEIEYEGVVLITGCEIDVKKPVALTYRRHKNNSPLVEDRMFEYGYQIVSPMGDAFHNHGSPVLGHEVGHAIGFPHINDTEFIKLQCNKLNNELCNYTCIHTLNCDIPPTQDPYEPGVMGPYINWFYKFFYQFRLGSIPGDKGYHCQDFASNVQTIYKLSMSEDRISRKEKKMVVPGLPGKTTTFRVIDEINGCKPSTLSNIEKPLKPVQHAASFKESMNKTRKAPYGDDLATLRIPRKQLRSGHLRMIGDWEKA